MTRRFADGGAPVAGRPAGAERLYDLTERVLPQSVLNAPTPPPADARQELVRLSVSALGIATVSELTNYFGLKTTDVRMAVRDLANEGAVEEARVQGWKVPAFVPRGLTATKHITARALLGPFDSLAWSRERTLRLFNFGFSFEIYVPEPKRRFGYYLVGAEGKNCQEISRRGAHRHRHVADLPDRGARPRPGGDGGARCHPPRPR